MFIFGCGDADVIFEYGDADATSDHGDADAIYFQRYFRAIFSAISSEAIFDTGAGQRVAQVPWQMVDDAVLIGRAVPF